MFNPDRNQIPAASYAATNYMSEKEHFVTAGLDWIPALGVHILPNIWYTRFVSMISGAIGTDRSNYRIVPRVTFPFKF